MVKRLWHWTDTRRAAARSLAELGYVAPAARAVGVSRVSLHTWLHAPEFAREVKRLQRARLRAWREEAKREIERKARGRYDPQGETRAA